MMGEQVTQGQGNPKGNEEGKTDGQAQGAPDLGGNEYKFRPVDLRPEQGDEQK
jgi:hypothetical protein